MDDQHSQRPQYWDPEIYLSDMEILDTALQHDLPICVSIDGSFDDDGVACTSIGVLAPDIRDTDMINSNAWQNRLAKVLLIRSWRLPKNWGKETASINMAEAIGFILGQYTIPAELPIIYIMNSNNARTLQRNIVNLNKFTHRKKVRQVKQGIDYSIASHLEHLTWQWAPIDQMAANMQKLNENGINICQQWTRQGNVALQEVGRRHNPPPYSCLNNEASPEADESSIDTGEDSTISKDSTDSDSDMHTHHRYRFDASMLDVLGHAIIIKVFSHKLNKDFAIKHPGNTPSPNLFVVSANQIADNAVAQARSIIQNISHAFDCTCYPPFSPRWCFTFEGKVTNKGDTKLLYTKLDDELCLRLQHRDKQGLLCRLLDFNGINANFIGNESMVRNVVKGTAPCLTRSIYCYPSLATLIWKQWYNTLSTSARATTSVTLPQGWQKIPSIADNIIKRCPFCSDI
jgi:hypothetical protein